MDEIMAAIERGRTGDREGAAAALRALWDSAGGALESVTIAHHLADLQDDPHEELLWDRRALAAVARLTDRHAQAFHESLEVRGFLPSLHLNLADVHHRLGHHAEARVHLASAQSFIDALANDGYGAMIRAGISNLQMKLAA
ncbi:MAG: hypothetical protein M3Q98_09230 [Actinomycetota bacterium]|nr:hypothetical protein [Actinomycetota bacterium]